MAGTQESPLLNFDINRPTESPFITDPAEAEALNVPVAYVRRIEEAQRTFSAHHLQHRLYTAAWSHATTTIAIQCGWLGIGSWVMSRGLRYSDPMNSIMGRWVQHTTLRRLTTPISCLGLTIVGATCTQLPYDIRLYKDAAANLQVEEQHMTAALREREVALTEGRAAMNHTDKEEHDRFTKNMAS